MVTVSPTRARDMALCRDFVDRSAEAYLRRGVQEASRGVALRRAYRRCVRFVSACSSLQTTSMAHLQVFLKALCRTRTDDPLLTMERPRQPVATHDNGVRLFEPFLRPSHLPPVATGCDRWAPQRLHPLLPVVNTAPAASSSCCRR